MLFNTDLVKGIFAYPNDLDRLRINVNSEIFAFCRLMFTQISGSYASSVNKHQPISNAQVKIQKGTEGTHASTYSVTAIINICSAF